MRTCGLAAALLALLSTSAASPLQPARSQPLRGQDALVRVYEFILDARFDQVNAELGRACGPAPEEACHVLEATAIWWRIQLDPENRARDAEFSRAVERAIQTTEAWTARAPDDAEASFYLGGAYAARVQWRVLRGEKLSAARDGKRIRQALERALQLDPSLDDAYFGIGLYRYYADVAPAAAKILRFLLLLPGGHREEGLAQMLRARERGRLLQGEADYQLHIIYLWYESQPERALELLRALHKHYPGNPLFLMQIAEVQDEYQHDITASLGTWQALLAMAREQRVNAAVLAEVAARLGIARHLDALHQTDQAIEQLEAVIAKQSDVPYASLARAYLLLGEAQDRLDDRAAAIRAYQRASALAAEHDAPDIRRQAAERQRRPPDAREAQAFRLSLEGWRLLEQNNLASAGTALERALTLSPRDPVARYRYGRLLLGRADDTAALAQFEWTIREARSCPAPILATAYLEAGRLHERAGRRDQAIQAYRTASTLFGGAEETRNAARRALKRIGDRSR
jgi:Tetratricopeptide repeat